MNLQEFYEYIKNTPELFPEVLDVYYDYSRVYDSEELWVYVKAPWQKFAERIDKDFPGMDIGILQEDPRFMNLEHYFDLNND